MNERLDRLAAAQATRPWRFVIAAIAITVLSVPLVARLGLNGDLTALLPENAASVRDLRAMGERFPSRQTFAMVVWSDDAEAMHRFTRDLVPALEPLRERGVVAIDWNIAGYAELIEDHAALYADLDDLIAIRDAMDLRHRYEVAQANPFEVWLDDEPGDELERLLEQLREEAEDVRWDAYQVRYPDGFFQHPDGRSVVVLMRTDIGGGGHDDMLSLIDASRRIVDSLEPTSYAPDLRVQLAGGVLEMHEEQEALADAAVLATAITLVMVMVAILAFFRRGRAVVILPLALVAPMALTFGIAELLVDYLNASSAFLSAIVIGNGINPHIIWLARYFELRRGGEAVEPAIAKTHRSTAGATLTASLAAALAYGSLAVTDFRAFRDFGIIGGIGMVLCWIAALTLTPALCALWERRRPMPAQAAQVRTPLYGRLLAAAQRAPRAVLVATALLTVAAGLVVADWARTDPFEYDFRNLQSLRPEGPLQRANRRVGDSVDQTTGGGALAVMTASPADTPHVVDQLEARLEDDPELFNRLRTVQDLLPADQEAKLPVLRDIRRLGLAMRGALDEETRAEVDRVLPPEDPRPLAADDLPETIQRPFRELDGTVGAMVYAEAHPSQSQSDGRYLLAWTGAARSARNRDGSPVAVAGAAPIVADLVAAIQRDGPRAVAISFAATVLLLLVAFRRWRARGLTIASHLVGIVWMVGAMAALGMKINFLNFVALPITFGNGVDYGVNVMRRFLAEREAAPDAPTAIRAAVGQTGGAVLLCALTTVIGYLALYTSPNQAVNSFGAAMSISELTCGAAALLALPAALRYADQPSSPTSGT